VDHLPESLRDPASTDGLQPIRGSTNINSGALYLSVGAPAGWIRAQGEKLGLMRAERERPHPVDFSEKPKGARWNR